MCLWGQRGLCYDACTIYWGRSTMQLIWASQKRACPKWHCAFVITKGWTCFLFMEIGAFEIQQSKMSFKDDISICDHTKKTSRIDSIYSDGFITIGVLTCASDQNHKSQAYMLTFARKIIYPNASLYKVCSKREYLSPGTELLLGPRKERGEWSPAPLWLQHHPVKGSFWFKWMEPRSGPRSLDTTQHAIASQSSTEHMFLWETRGGFRNFGMEGPEWGHVCEMNIKMC